MKERPSLDTPRLLLRPFRLTDAPDVQRLAGAREVASTTLRIPHPYEAGMAEAWIGTHQEGYEQGTLVNFAIVLRADQALMGGIGLRLDPLHSNAELGYWLGIPYWNCGYGTEAAGAVVAYGLEVLGLHRLHTVILCYHRQARAKRQSSHGEKESLLWSRPSHASRWCRQHVTSPSCGFPKSSCKPPAGRR